MLDAAEEALSFIQDRERTDLDRDRMLVLSLLKEIEILGEAASKISNETQRQCHEIPWNDIIGMRNRLIHGYFDVNLEVVWKTIVADLLPLTNALRRIIKPEAENPSRD